MRERGRERERTRKRIIQIQTTDLVHIDGGQGKEKVHDRGKPAFARHNERGGARVACVIDIGTDFHQILRYFEVSGARSVPKRSAAFLIRTKKKYKQIREKKTRKSNKKT